MELSKDLLRYYGNKYVLLYNYYTNKRWGDAAGYDLCLCSSKLGIDGTAEAIRQYVELKESTKDSKI